MNSIRYHAVIVGINTYIYPDSYHSLRYAQRDAKSLRDKLIMRSGGIFSANTIYLLTNDADDARMPTRANIFVALNGMCVAAGENDLILFYFAGHGFGDEESSYLIACDTPPIESVTITLRDVTLSVDRILGIMKTSRAKNKVMLLDACRKPITSETEARSPQDLESKTRHFTMSLVREINSHSNLPGWELISACGKSEVAHETDELQGGVWTQSFLGVIDKMGSCTGITVEDLFKETNKRVEKWGQEKNKKQTPYYNCDIHKSIVLFPSIEQPDSDAVFKLSKIISEREVQVLVRENLGPFTKRLQWKEDSMDATVHLVPFRSIADRLDLLRLSPEIHKANQEFTIRLYLPSIRRVSPPYNRLYLLFNGLGEADPYIFDDIGWELADSKGIPAILMPLPVHFTRRVQSPENLDDPYKVSTDNEMRLITQQILQEIFCRPARILAGFGQVMRDTKRLIEIIKDGDDPYWSSLFEKNPSISLFGYSIGGFAALSMLLHDPKLYQSVFLLESGVAIDQINAGIMYYRPQKTQEILWKKYFEEAKKHNKVNPYDPNLERLFSLREQNKEAAFNAAYESDDIQKCGEKDHPERVFDRTVGEGQEIWRDIVTSLYDDINNAHYLTGNEIKIFKWVFLANEPLIYKKKLSELSQKLLIIAGGADEIFPARSLLNIGPDTGLAILQLPGVTHWIKYQSRTKWQRWKTVLIDLMETFNKLHPSSTEL